LWGSAERLGRLASAAEGWVSPAEAADGDLDLVHDAAGRVVGLDRVEEWCGQPFRWSGPIAVIRVRVRAAGRARLELLPVRPPPLDVRVIVDGHRLPSADV